METRSRDSPANSDAPPPPQPPPTAETLADAPRRRGAGALKRKASSNLSSAPSKRLIKERNALNIPSLHNGPLTRARQTPSRLAGAAAQRAAEEVPATAAALEGFSKVGPAGGGSIGDEVVELVPVDEPIVDAEFDLVRSRGSGVHVVPTPAGEFKDQLLKSSLCDFSSSVFEKLAMRLIARV